MGKPADKSDESGSDSSGSGSSDDDSDSDSDGSDGSDDMDVEQKPKKPRAPRVYNDVQEGRTVFVRNLPFDLPQPDVLEEFEDFGEVTLCKLVINRETGQSRGIHQPVLYSCLLYL